jgi:hypothetical protein
MWWRSDGYAERKPASARDHIERIAGYRNQRGVDDAQLERKECKLCQHQRTRLVCGHWIHQGHAHRHDNVHGDRLGTGRNHRVLDCGKRDYLRSNAHGYVRRPAEQHCCGLIGSSELDDNQCDLGEHRRSGNVWANWID